MLELSRRSVLRGGLLTGLAGVVGFLVARSGDASLPKSGVNAYGTPATGEGSLAALTDVPTGGGLVLDKRRIVLTRDGQGTVRGFSAVCTHQGCTVDTVEDGKIVCPCHGSAFDAVTGARVQGPAQSPLRSIAVEVRDGEVFAG